MLFFFPSPALWLRGLAACLVFAAPSLSHAVLPARTSQDDSRENAASAYRAVQQRLARGWNTWDVNSMTTHVLLPEGLAIQFGLKHNTTEGGDAFLRESSVGHGEVFPGPHAWDGSYTDLKLTWKGHVIRVQSAHQGSDLVLLVTPAAETEAKFSVPATAVFAVNFLWNLPGTALRKPDSIETNGSAGAVPVYCTCTGSAIDDGQLSHGNLPVSGPYFAADLTQPLGVSTGHKRSLREISMAIEQQHQAYLKSIQSGGQAGGRSGLTKTEPVTNPTTETITDAIETALGWDTIYDPSKQRVVSPVSRDWSVGWGGYVIFDWDTFFAATMASVGDRDLAYANAIETLHESTAEGFVPNYARQGGWKSSDRSEPPVGSITVLGLYNKFHDRWFLEEAYPYLLRWNAWWAAHRDYKGYLTWGSDGANEPQNLDDDSRGKRFGAILESGLDNSPMYDETTYDPKTHLLEFGDVGLMSMYIADCDALTRIAETLGKAEDVKTLQTRAAKYRNKLATMWSDKEGIFLNQNLHTGKASLRLSPTNFYPLLAGAASNMQAETMIESHLTNPKEFWGEWVIPSIARDDPAFKDQNYWRGRIWGPMNYLVYLGLENYDEAAVRREFAQKSFNLFLKEWREKGHVHENYNAILGTGDDVRSSDRFYHWGALLGYIEYLQESSDK